MIFSIFYYKMGPHLQHSAVHRDAVTSKQPGKFVTAPESQKPHSPLYPVIHGIHELPNQPSPSEAIKV